MRHPFSILSTTAYYADCHMNCEQQFFGQYASPQAATFDLQAVHGRKLLDRPIFRSTIIVEFDSAGQPHPAVDEAQLFDCYALNGEAQLVAYGSSGHGDICVDYDLIGQINTAAGQVTSEASSLALAEA